MGYSIKRFCQKILIRNRKHINKELYVVRLANEKKIIGICHQLIIAENTKLSYKPYGVNLGKRYIENDRLEKYIIVDDNMVKIVNGVCSYDIPISMRTARNISIIFDSKVNQLRTLLEDKINSKVKHSLDTIYDSLIQRQTEPNRII